MKVGGEVTPSALETYGIKTFVLSESCVFTASQKQKASMDLLYNDELTLGKILASSPRPVRWSTAGKNAECAA